MNEQEILYHIALTLTPQLKIQAQRRLIEAFGSATNVFQNRHNPNSALPDATPLLKETLKSLEGQLKRAEEELTFIQRYHIRCLCIGDTDYPSRLKECPDAPIILYYKGRASLNAPHVVSMVGTRRCTEYGKDLCRHFAADLKTLCPDTLIVSGLAYGIDIHSQRAALNNHLNTVAVLAHGLDTIYPSIHRDDALQMIEHGGLLTEFKSKTTPERRNFISRNRIIAGIADAVVVVESGEKGGALITADFALNYNREVFTFPGRTTDEFSIGCNRLVSNNKATIILNAKDLTTAMDWKQMPNPEKPETYVQRELFPDLNPEERQIVDLLKTADAIHVNAIAEKLGMPIHRVSACLVNLEIIGVVKSLRGSMYKLL